MSSSPSERTSPTPQDLRFTTLLRLMAGEFKDSAVTSVLSHRSELPEDVRSALASVINREVRVPGFPNFPEKALPAILKPAILGGLQESDTLVSAVLSAWFALHSSLRDVVTEHLRNRGVDTGHPDFRKHQLDDYWSLDDWTSERDSILRSNHDLHKDDVALMLCCVTGRMPSAIVESSGEENRTIGQTILDQALSYLEQLPADSPEWEAVPGFLSSVTALSDVKAAERDTVASREALESELSEFLDLYSDHLEYLELDVSGWSLPTDRDVSVMSEAFDFLRQLSKFFADYNSIPHQGDTYAETRRLFNEREAVIHHIRCAKSRLDGMLTTGGGPEDAPGHPSTSEDDSDDATGQLDSGRSDSTATIQPEAVEARRDLTLSGLRLSDQLLDFDPATLNYPVVLDDSDVVVITPVANHSEAKIDVFVESQDGGPARQVESDTGAYTVENIPVGQTRILVNVTDEDRETGRTYILAVTRAASSNSRLRSLDSSVARLEFSPDLAEYRVDLPDGADELSFAFKTVHDAATVEVTLERPDGVTTDSIEPEDGTFEVSGLAEGRSVLSVAVTAEDGVTATAYRVELLRRSRRRIDHVELMWSLVGRDDIAGAYWISKSLAAQGQAPPYVPLLLKAVQGARWLSPDSKDFIEDLFGIVSETSPPFDDDAYAMLSLAAAIQPSIIAPETNLLAWVTTPDLLPTLEGIVSPVRNFANWGYALRPEHIRGDEGQRRLDDLIGAASSEASRWLEDAERRRHKLVRATNVLRHLCADRGMLNALLSPVAGDRRGDVPGVRSDIEALKQDSYRTEVIAEADSLMRGSSPRPDITGAAREWLQRRIGEACDVATRWCDLVGRDDQAREQAQNQWLFNQVSDLRTQVESASLTIFEELSVIASDPSRMDLSASALCLARSIHRVLDYLRIDQDMDSQSQIPSVVTDLQTIVRNGGHATTGFGSKDQLETGLSVRLLWVPGVDLGDDGRPLNPETPVDPSEADEDWFSSDTTVESAVRARVNTGDFRFLDLLKTVWAADHSDAMDALYSADLAAAKVTLDEHLESTRDDVDQAANDGVIEYEGARWNEFAHVLDDIIVDKVLNFKHVHDSLDAIQRRVRDERTRRREELIGEWEHLVRESNGGPDREVEFIKGLTSTFELASRDESLDIRVMEDSVSRMRNYRSGDRHDLVLALPEDSRQTLEDFLSFYSAKSDRQSQFDVDELKNLVRRSRGEV